MSKIDQLMNESEKSTGECMMCHKKNQKLYAGVCKSCFKEWAGDVIRKETPMTDVERTKMLILKCLTHGNLPNNINYEALAKEIREEARKISNRMTTKAMGFRR